ncbi:MAG TPA: hypothetical protein DEE98_03560 [Elusimicrobia bacterium]|nr:MAG: hypothetical protein A2278_02585 [Elusimicrobia bacterium RIFOXYA12_FULL_49_49]OGS16369.1 MAG: hypothetical protein A2251_06035 [Elusimicrobia bacterium RIFOXYA2_FULL_47_53]OGS30453.1 MAG: hypothetical protein A2323_03000 [Elusimicrobia bacterium RIFOXYB2_FULL_46_23]HBU69443.1 hypothetical protein [Elusimicrobiota bacterium]
MRLSLLFKAAALSLLLPCLAWSANVTVTVTDPNGAAVSGADVLAITYSTSGPVCSPLVKSDSNGSAVLALTNGLHYQLVAVKSGYLPSARDQMFNWNSSIYASADTSKPIQIRPVTSADSVKDIMVTVTHNVPAGKLLFLNLMNKGTYEQAGMGFLVSTGSAVTPCYIYSAPTNTQDLPFQLDVYDPDNQRGSRVAVNNKPDTTVEADATSLDISANSGAMAPPSRQLETDEKLGEVAIEGVVSDAATNRGIEGVNVNIHDQSDHSLNMNTQTDANGYYAFYENADATTEAARIFKNGHDIGVNFMKNGYVSDSWSQITYSAGKKSTMTVSMTPVNGKIKGIISIKVGNEPPVPIPQAWVNAWSDNRNYGTSDVWGSTDSDRVQGMGNASSPVQKGNFELTGLPSGRYTLNIWSEFNNQPIIFNNGPDGIGAVDSNNWNTANTAWGDDYIVQVTTQADANDINNYAKVLKATTPHDEVTTARDSEGNILITILKTPDGTNSITGQITFEGATTPIDPSTVLIVARENWNNNGVQPKSGFTVLKAADKVSDYVYNYSITGLGDAVYRVEVKASGFGMKFDNQGPRTNEGITLNASATTKAVDLRMAVAGVIGGSLRTPKGTIYVPKFDGPDNSSISVNANNNEQGCWGWAQVEKDGSFRIEGLLPGKYSLRAEGWGNSYAYATAYMKNIIVEASKTTTVEIPLRKGVKVHPVLSAALPAELQADLAQSGNFGQKANMSVVYTPASVALSAKNIDQIFKMMQGGDQENTMGYWGGSFQDVSLEPGAYNFYLLYEKNYPMNSKNYAKTIIGRAKNFVVDESKAKSSYAMNGSTMNMVSALFVPIDLNIGDGSLSGSYAGKNTFRGADMDKATNNFNVFLAYSPRVTLLDKDGNILGTGMCTNEPGPGDGGEPKKAPGDGPNDGENWMPKMSYSIPYIPAQENVKMVVTTLNYPPLVKIVKIPGTQNIDLDADVGPGAKISGTVYDTTGKAVSGAIVTLKGRLSERTVKTGTDGSYSMLGLAAGVYRMLVTAEGYALDAQKVITYNKDQIVNFLLTPCAGVISGKVYSQKFPYQLVAAGAQIVAYDDTANGLDPTKEIAIYETITDNNGAYKISPVIEGHTYKVALAVPGKKVQIYTPSPELPAAAGSAVSGVDFTYISKPPQVKLKARADSSGNSVTLQGEVPRKLNNLTAKYNEGSAYNASAAANLTVSPVGMKSYTITLPDKTKFYTVRLTVDDGATLQEADFVYNPGNSAQARENIDQQSVASGDVTLDSQGNDTSGLYISPGSITLGDDSDPELSIEKEMQESSPFVTGVPTDEIGGDVYNITLDMDGSQQNDNKTMTLTLGYDSTLVGEKTDSLSVRQYNETTKTWDPILGATMVDPISGTVSVEVENIATAAAASASPRRKPSLAKFNGKEYKLSPSNGKGAASSNQKGIFMVSRVPARMPYAGSSLEVFNVPNPFDLTQKAVTLNRGGSIAQITTEGTVIRFAIPASFGTNVRTRFRIYNIAAELVRELNANDMLVGNIDGGYYYYLDWDGKNKSGSKCASGVYLCVAEVGTEKKTIKMALIK